MNLRGGTASVGSFCCESIVCVDLLILPHAYWALFSSVCYSFSWLYMQLYIYEVWKDQGRTTPGWHFSLGEKLFMPWAGFEPTSPWLPVGCDYHYRATMLATWPIWIANGNYVVIPGLCFSPTRWRWINPNDDSQADERERFYIQVTKYSRKSSFTRVAMF